MTREECQILGHPCQAHLLVPYPLHSTIVTLIVRLVNPNTPRRDGYS